MLIMLRGKGLGGMVVVLACDKLELVYGMALVDVQHLRICNTKDEFVCLDLVLNGFAWCLVLHKSNLSIKYVVGTVFL